MLTFQHMPNENYAAAESSVEGGKCRIEFTPSPHRGIAAMWFLCRIACPENEVLPVRTIVRLKNIQGMLGGGAGLFLPVIRFGSGDWKRLPRGRRIVGPDSRIHLEWELETPPPGRFFDLAFSFPYEEAQLEKLLCDTGSYWNVDEIGVTGADHRMLRLSNRYGKKEEPDSGLYLLARQHAGEVSGSWVLDGILRRFAERRPAITVWCVPFADPDGIANGDYGKDSFPHDMNRAWGPYEYMRRETKIIGADLREWHSRILPEQSFVMDFHSPGAEETGVYAYCSDEEKKAFPSRRTVEILEQIGAALGTYSQTPFIKTKGYQKFSAWGNFASLSDFCLWTVPVPYASFETSYFEAGGRTLTPEHYQEIGSRIADEIQSVLVKDSSSARP